MVLVSLFLSLLGTGVLVLVYFQDLCCKHRYEYSETRCQNKVGQSRGAPTEDQNTKEGVGQVGPKSKIEEREKKRGGGGKKIICHSHPSIFKFSQLTKLPFCPFFPFLFFQPAWKKKKCSKNNGRKKKIPFTSSRKKKSIRQTLA